MGSASPDFSIPPEFQSRLKLVEPLDTRSDAEIVSSLTQNHPVTSEKNIWGFWHSGVNGMPAWCRRNVIDWLRINGPSWTVRILDSDPSSPNFLLRYISEDVMPEAIVKGEMTGPFTGQHTADFVRSAVIYRHGGVFMDVGILLIRRLDRICWDQLADPASPYNMAIPSLKKDNICNHFVACRAGDPFIKRWHDILLQIWEGRTEGKGAIISNPLIRFIIEKDASGDADVRKPLGWDMKDFVTILEYVGQILAFQRICHLNKADEDGFNCYEYWCKNVLVWNCLSEHWAAEEMAARTGPHPWIMERLAMRRDENAGSEDYKAGYEMTWRMLTRSSLMKVTSAQGMTITPHLGALWSRPENAGKDCAEGTFAELLRYGSVHFEQTRESIEYFDDLRLKGPIDKTLLEP
ncbi:hypothetical protein BDV96DRAFT_598802 [Lophiotrema nucula]|uniref:Capsule polysaccharide biosynthesis protein n=1 Tax=Lophiotrema nucula TaxID=690887 RepID=A0A6A5ZCA3_9PLEO|nr:hypothetical protein BDV96DRAFT_598802 [Lophiotrema nucula]